MANIVNRGSFSIIYMVKDFSLSMIESIKELVSDEKYDDDLELQVKKIEKQQSNYIKELEDEISFVKKGESKKTNKLKKAKKVTPTKTTVNTKHNQNKNTDKENNEKEDYERDD